MISIFTPSHRIDFLKDAYKSVRAQTLTDWEWVVLLNGDAKDEHLDFNDDRVKIFRTDESGSVGPLKKLACSYATGDILLELDHDDLLTPDCLSEVQHAFDTQPDVVFVYSNFVEVDEHWRNRRFSEKYGWHYRAMSYDGHDVLECIAPDPHPQIITRIWFAPNHVRAWRKDVYDAIGGHPDMKIADDHELLMRTWLHGKMLRIDKPLYIYRVHGKNTWLQHAHEIQTEMWNVYDKYSEQIALKWAKDNNLQALDLCGGIDKPAGYTSVDMSHGDIDANLDEAWPFEDNSVGVIRAHDAIEHLKNPIHTMNEAWRVLAHGGFLRIDVPSTDGAGAWCDPTHVSFWNSRSFRYYTEQAMRRYLGDKCNCRFQKIKVENILKWDNVPYVRAHLIAIKNDTPRFHGELLI